MNDDTLNYVILVMTLLTIAFVIIGGTIYFNKKLTEKREQELEGWTREQMYYYCENGKHIEREEHYDLFTNYSLSCENIQEILLFGTREQHKRKVIFYKNKLECEGYPNINFIDTIHYNQEYYKLYYNIKCQGGVNYE